MPTDAEWAELMNNCIWIWTIRNGTKGFEVKSQKAGYEDKSIFIPAAGYRVNDYFVGALDMIQSHYGIMHTQRFEDMVEGLSAFCKRKGGNLS